MPNEILYDTGSHIFSFRVAGILIWDDNVLLQHNRRDTGFVFPGGRVRFEESSVEALQRLLREKLNTDVTVEGLQWVAEMFFPVEGKPCHQISHFYRVALPEGGPLPRTGSFRSGDLGAVYPQENEFLWQPLSRLDAIEIYPKQAKDRLWRYSDAIRHFVSREG